MDTQKRLDEFQSKLDGLKKKTDLLQENLANAGVTVSSQDESVTVTVGPNGSLQNLSLSHRAAEHSPPRLTALIMQTVGRAQRQVAQRVAEAFAPIGANTAAMRMLTSYLPPADEDTDGHDGTPSHGEPSVPDGPPAAPPRPAAHPLASAPPAAPPRAARPRPAGGDEDETEVQPW
ncbi:YbaB/EbfC family nucleoid-associated protein [Solihabitans fulvus]|uniref:YbaB/EbfC family nucleoid-associated protein n=1 Tax=Solihabitans fulvus TaxID=1892852 RepID=A0A5B2XFR4_9PSEU|nr:YbaB/EbfC family nucleoid-associated protein [Solihabitans fulvus]KAA2262668.1 YbaB/EbfC family nucleoid-associated protein [Solihabitans fulvus]